MVIIFASKIIIFADAYAKKERRKGRMEMWLRNYRRRNGVVAVTKLVDNFSYGLGPTGSQQLGVATDLPVALLAPNLDVNLQRFATSPESLCLFERATPEVMVFAVCATEKRSFEFIGEVAGNYLIGVGDIFARRLYIPTIGALAC